MIWKKTSDVIKLPGHPQALRVINGQLWCCCENIGILVFDAELRHQWTVATTAASRGKVFDVASLAAGGGGDDGDGGGGGEIVVATASGLYHADSTGEH